MNLSSVEAHESQMPQSACAPASEWGMILFMAYDYFEQIFQSCYYSAIRIFLNKVGRYRYRFSKKIDETY